MMIPTIMKILEDDADAIGDGQDDSNSQVLLPSTSTFAVVEHPRPWSITIGVNLTVIVVMNIIILI